MAELDLVQEVVDTLAVDPDEFADTVDREAEWLTSAVREGVFDNPQAIVGFEYEFYGADEETGELVRMPRRLLEYIGFEKELGLHNAEMSTSPQPLNEYGLAAQETEIRARLEAALQATGTEGIRLVSDGMWTIPPANETARSYLTDSVEDAGIRVATNMSESVRYHAFSNTQVDGYTPKMRLEAPNVDFETDTVLLESLITSIQPHYQVPSAVDLPAYFQYALRIAGPLLALGVNSPFFPPDLYADDATAEDVLRDAHMEHRVGVFETSLNPATDHEKKVRFPREIETVDHAIERIVADHTVVPTNVPDSGRFDDQFKHLRHKHGSFWRWVRPVFDGATRSSANARIEFRPIPAQPTVRDGVAFLATFAGLLESLPRHEHPIVHQDWDQARDNFYAAAEDGLQADVAWITADGETTTDPDVLYPELFEYARDGLELAGVDPSEAEDYVRPLRERAATRLTPARWKHRRVRRAVDNGADLDEAIREMQEAYIERQEHSIIEGDFGMWIAGEG